MDARTDWFHGERCSFISWRRIRLYARGRRSPREDPGDFRQFIIQNPTFRDVPGLCKAASIQDIAAQGWPLNPGRYVGVAAGEAVSDEDFKEQLETMNEELESLNAQARGVEGATLPHEQTIAGNVAEILEA